ncbi:MAG: FadR family transcriptional regulator [Pseudomonadales bacterium]|nr:FadR family transcriptional regulator [Pseudomonadales bacterium]
MAKFEPIETTERLYVQVARRISELIESGNVKTGDKLPSERDLADMLNVSRPSIREAMIALEVSGVIEVRTGSGIYVCGDQSVSDADEGVGPFEILEMRLLVEPEACALAAERITNEQLARLQQIYIELERTNGTQQMEAFDEQFHKLIGEATENTAIGRTISWLWVMRGHSQLSRGYHRLIVEEGVYPRLDEHKKILDALMSHDPEAAKSAMHKHLLAATASAAKHFTDQQ